MEDKFDIHVLNWYRQFVHEKSEKDDHTSPNFFVRVDENYVKKFKTEFGSILPDMHIEFLLLVGSGRVREDISGKFSESYENYFFNTLEMGEILQRKSKEWELYPDFIAENEVPFFSIGNNDVLVFRKDKGSKVYFPYFDDVYAENFGDFIKKIMRDINFYSEIHIE